MAWALEHVLSRLVRRGRLKVTWPDGTTSVFGNGGEPGAAVRITDRATLRKLLIHPDLYLGEAYVDGEVVIEHGTVYDLTALLFDNIQSFHGGRLPVPSGFAHRLRRWRRWIMRYNPVGRARRNVAHHYDLSGELYDLFLDRDRQYSCAYFEHPNQSLAEAQLAKKRLLAAKLDIKPGMRVLDIGSGWGGLGLYLAEVCKANVVGITLSEEQHKLSSQRAHQRGMAEQVQFRLQDYREIDERFDRIVSVGMFEHVGVVHYAQFFERVVQLLKKDGVAVLHSIARATGAGVTSAWINKYIFPGGYIPGLSEVVPHIERAGLYISDIEILRLHYADTLKHWRQRFADHRDQAKALFDERFCRMWEFYLAASECSFRFGTMNNFQIQMVRDQHVLPITRDYIEREFERLRRIDSQRPRFTTVPAE